MKRGTALARSAASLTLRSRLSCSRQWPSPFTETSAAVWASHGRSHGFHTTSGLYRERVDTADRPDTLVKEQGISDFAFAFDIDGVLTQGKKAIPGARETLRALRARGIPYILLTNGGGYHEDDKVKSLSRILGFSVGEDVVADRVILSHTPKRGWADSEKEGTVLITGSHPEAARKLAREYGFSRVVTPADLLAENESIYPFAKLRDSLHSSYEPLPSGATFGNLKDPYSKEIPPKTLKIDKIFIWNDPRDWSLDIQVINDLLISREGYLGTISDKNGNAKLPNNGWQQDGQPEVWISNLDLLWKTDYPINRFGTGSFIDALKGVWSAATDGAELHYNALGKPSKHTYEYAHDRLLHYASDLATTKGRAAAGAPRTKVPLRHVYMIGDNPESDIRGANDFAPADGTRWLSVLVKTGVWRETAAERVPRHKPVLVGDDVVDGVVGALRNEGVEVDRESFLASGKTGL